MYIQLPRRGIIVLALLASLACWLATPASTSADVFDRHQLKQLRQVAQSAEPIGELPQKQASQLKTLGSGIVSPCIVVQTGSGNFAKALLSWGLRKGTGKPVSVLMLDRFVTYDAQRPGVSLASGKDVMLFGGFGFDFDIGQVVPEGQGGDIEFTAERSIKALEGARLFALDGSAVAQPPAGEAGSPGDHDGVLPQDFSGAWRVNADGRWLGTWELEVDGKGNVDGQYLSDETQSTYKIIGKVDGAPHRMILEIELVNAAQSYEVFLWTSDKSAMAGTTTLEERKFGFYALRQEPAASAPGTGPTSSETDAPAPQPSPSPEEESSPGEIEE